MLELLNWSHTKAPDQGGYGLFGGGDKTGATATTEKYTYNTQTFATGSLLGVARAGLAACGNATMGVFAGGNGKPTGSSYYDYVDRYTYVGETVAPGAVLMYERGVNAGCGNADVGIFGGGIGPSVNSRFTFKYTYASNTSGQGGSLTIWDHCYPAAVGNATFGFIAAGSNGGGSPYNWQIEKYTYATDTPTYTAGLGLARERLAACGNNFVGIFAGGNGDSGVTAYLDKYTYANNTVAPGTVLGLARQWLSSTGNATEGIFAGGYAGGYSNYTDKYTYVNDTIAPSTVLPAARYGSAGVSSTPGGF